MSRDSSGNYSLPLANVVTGTTVSSSWANTSFGDFATEFTNSLDRTGRGGMLAPLRCADGSAASPSYSFTTETGSGFYLAGVNDLRVVMVASPLQKWTPTAVTIYPATTLESTLTVKGNTTLGDAVGDTTTVKGPATLESTLVVTGTTTSTGVLSTNAGSETFQLKPGSQDHAYLAFYARTASPSTRSGFIGYASAASADLAITNGLANGLVALTPGSGGRVQVGGNVAFSGVSNPASTTAFQNTITPANVPKAFAKVSTSGAGAVTVSGGFNITAAISGTAVRFTFPVGGTMANANYTVTITHAGSEGVDYYVSAQTTSTFDVSAFTYALNGPGTAVVPSSVLLSTTAQTFHVVVHGLQ